MQVLQAHTAAVKWFPEMHLNILKLQTKLYNSDIFSVENKQWMSGIILLSVGI